MTHVSLARALEVLRRGGVVACPTETLVGLLADALDDAAVARVVAAKKRPSDAPLALLVPDLAGAEALVELDEAARALAEAHWPGALTLVARTRVRLPAPLLRDGTVGVRVPGPSLALDLVRAFGGPLTATSANLSGEPAIASTDDLDSGLVLDAVVAGKAGGGPPSTIVDVSVSPFRLIRAGAVTL